MPKRRARNDANTTANIINVLPGKERTITREVLLHNAPESDFTPGCGVTLYTGTLTESPSYNGSTGAVTVPAATPTLPLYIVDIHPMEGWDMTSEFGSGDQIPVINLVSGSKLNVRVPSDETIVRGQLLRIATDGSGMFVPTTDAASASGMAAEDAAIKNPEWPTWCLMEVF